MKAPRDYQPAVRAMAEEQLYEMLAHEADYLPAAIAAARAELSRRELNPHPQFQLPTGEEVRPVSLPTWEYRVETVRGMMSRPSGKSWHVMRVCGELGAQGWELASVNYSWFLLAYILYFKRPKQTPSAA